MGNCFKKSIDPPKVVYQITSKEVRKIIESSLRAKPDHVKLADGNYGLYSLQDLKRFLNHDKTDKYNYIKESFDCDDFADVLKGHEREWFRFHKQPMGSTFGIVWGDIRNDENSDKPRPHAVNYFIDDDKKLWLIEPQTDNIFEFTNNSTAWIVVG